MAADPAPDDEPSRGAVPAFGHGVPVDRRHPDPPDGSSASAADAEKAGAAGPASPRSRPASSRDRRVIETLARLADLVERSSARSDARPPAAVARTLRGRLDERALGGYAPPATGAATASAPQPIADGPEAAPRVTAVRPHPSESLESLVGRASAVLNAGSALLLVGDRYGTPVASLLADALSDGRSDAPVACLEDVGLDLLRTLASEPKVGLDLVAPDAFASGLAASLDRLRDSAARERRRRAEVSDEARATRRGGPWFGLGIVDEPSAPIVLRRSLGRTLRIDRVDGGVSVSTTGEETIGADQEARGESLSSLRDAAHAAVDASFGAAVQGGLALDAVGRIVVDDRSFSEFTGHFLARLEDVDRAPSHAPPAWSLEGSEVASALQAARKIGLDEGATLLLERSHRRGAGRSRRGQDDARRTHGLVFTNVERRMRLGGAIRPLGVVALMRASTSSR